MIPRSCIHGLQQQKLAPPLPTCPHCKGKGRVDFESDEYPPGTVQCCCTCPTCRAEHDAEERVTPDTLDVVAGVLLRERRVWLAQRYPSPVAEWSEAWCLPGGKVEPGESLEAALRREWQEEAAVDVTVGAKLACRLYTTAGFAQPYRVHTFLVSCDGEPRLTPAGGQRAAWWSFDQLPTPRLPSTDALLLVLR